jgi:hypothetical protein
MRRRLTFTSVFQRLSFVSFSLFFPLELARASSSIKRDISPGGVLCESLAARRVSTLKLTNCFLDPRSDD